MKTTKVYEVKMGYTTIGAFDNIDDALAFFSSLVKGSGRHLNSIDKKGKKAHYWGGEVEFSMEISEVEIFPSRKDAEFAIFEASKE